MPLSVSLAPGAFGLERVEYGEETARRSTHEASGELRGEQLFVRDLAEEAHLGAHATGSVGSRRAMGKRSMRKSV